MGIFDFVKSAGAKVLGAIPGADAAQRLRSHLDGSGVEGGRELQVEYDPSTATAKVTGAASDQAAREKLVLALGNVEGVEKVEEAIVVEKPEPEARFYTVKKGDTLSAIAKAHYGSANKYPLIFEANRPLLSHPDKIYPGQVLRIPEA
jgi:nucleoid-associated protein YgaU